MNAPRTARRIVVVQDFLRSGGTERQTLLLAGEFAAAGREVTLLTFRPGGALAAQAPPGVRRVVLQPFDTGFDWFAPSLCRAIADAKPDAVLCMGRMANCLAGRVKRSLPKTPVVATMRTGKPLPWLYRRSLRRVDAVVANSAAAARALAGLRGVRTEKIHIIHNAPVFEPDAGGNAADIADGNAPDDGADAVPDTAAATANAPLVVLCVAMFRPEKNHVTLLRAAERFPAEPRWRLVLAGDGPERAACEAFARRSPALDGRVEFAGFQADPRPLYHAAAVAVLASLRESLPNFLVESHLHGVPSVAFDVGGVSECGGETVPAGDADALAAAVSRLLLDSRHRSAAAARARVFASVRFTRAAQTRAHLALFDSLASLKD